MKPKLSIVIPAYNVEKYILEAVESALAQTFSDLEVIVVDDGSKDGTVAALAGIDDPRLRVISQANRGLAGARNTGIREARGEYIGFLDADDTWMPEKAAKHIALMEREPDVGLTYSHSLFIDEQSVTTGRVLFSRASSPTLAQVVRRNRVGNGSSPIARAKVFEIAGHFDEALISLEDWEMWIRIQRDTPYSARLVPEVLNTYRINTQSLSMNFDPYMAKTGPAIAKVARETPQVPTRVHREGHATIWRIAATKALYNDQRAKSLEYLLRAFRICPWLLLVDPRAWVTVAMLPLPKKMSVAARTFVGRVVRPISSHTSHFGHRPLAAGSGGKTASPNISS
jgi:glycosyltransferase involved in cell wall biosynthesis